MEELDYYDSDDAPLPDELEDLPELEDYYDSDDDDTRICLRIYDSDGDDTDAVLLPEPSKLDSHIALPDELEDDNNDALEAADVVVLRSELQQACCKNGCLLLDSVQAAHQAWHVKDSGARSKEEGRAMLLSQIRDRVKSTHDYHRPYHYFGTRVCREAFQKLWGCSGWLLDHYRKCVLQDDATLPPQDLRKSRYIRESRPASECADSFWLWAYDNLTENLAEGLSC